jgi:rubrerythrin
MTTSPPVATTDPWLHPLAASEPPPLSDRLIRALEAHAAAEVHDVGTCQQIAQRTADPAVRFLFDLVLEDEQRHHSVIQSMIRRLQEEVEFVPSPDAMPVADAPTSADPEMVASVRALIRDEQEGARYLRHLARQEPALYGGLFSMLLETIARDSEKHAAIFRYVLRRLEA